jgi:hypothetical protein
LKDDKYGYVEKLAKREMKIMEIKENNQTRPSLEDILWEVVQHYGDYVPYHPWFNEQRRWHELIVCTLFSLIGGDGSQAVRRAVDILVELNLLNIPDLSALPWVEDSLDLTHPHIALMRQILERLGFAAEVIPVALAQIVQLAQDVHHYHQDHIQIYLRQHGQRMLANLQQDFPSLPVDSAPLQSAFATWLQNVLTMPIFLDTPNARLFCEAAGCTLSQLHETADKLNVSASLLDDMLDFWAAERDLWQL